MSILEIQVRTLTFHAFKIQTFSSSSANTKFYMSRCSTDWCTSRSQPVYNSVQTNTVAPSIIDRLLSNLFTRKSFLDTRQCFEQTSSDQRRYLPVCGKQFFRHGFVFYHLPPKQPQGLLPYSKSRRTTMHRESEGFPNQSLFITNGYFGKIRYLPIRAPNVFFSKG